MSHKRARSSQVLRAFYHLIQLLNRVDVTDFCYDNIFFVNPASNDEMMMLWKVGSFVLLLAFGVVLVVLTYYIKKKVHTADISTHKHKHRTRCEIFCFQQKPQYQPQLQMIQMVGPNDNDYIYINFKDFKYDMRWEFPRENLELGRRQSSSIKYTLKVLAGKLTFFLCKMSCYS